MWVCYALVAFAAVADGSSLRPLLAQRGGAALDGADPHPDTGQAQLVTQLDELDEVDGLEFVQPNVTAEACAINDAASRFSKRVLSSLAHHVQPVQDHCEYVAALAARSGILLWHGRTLVATWLIRLRLTAFTSEVGESLRPLIAVSKVRFCYAISWIYVLLDVLIRTADEMSLRGRTWRVMRTLLFFSVFHTLATMLLPAYLIHTAVHQAHRALHHAATPARLASALQHWAPTAVGLLLIPLMPLLDEPMEQALERLFHVMWPLPPALVAPSSLTDYQAAQLREESCRMADQLEGGAHGDRYVLAYRSRARAADQDARVSP